MASLLAVQRMPLVPLDGWNHDSRWGGSNGVVQTGYAFLLDPATETFHFFDFTPAVFTLEFLTLDSIFGVSFSLRSEEPGKFGSFGFLA